MSLPTLRRVAVDILIYLGYGELATINLKTDAKRSSTNPDDIYTGGEKERPRTVPASIDGDSNTLSNTVSRTG